MIATVGIPLLAGAFDTLEEWLELIWADLVAAVPDQHHPYHWPILASVDEDGAPQARCVVLRAVDREARSLEFQTDVRSPKVRHIRRDPRLGWCFNDHRRRIQLRAETRASLHRDGPAFERAWKRVGRGSRLCYLAPEAPGAASATETTNLPTEFGHEPPDETALQRGRDNFCLVACEVVCFDLLALGGKGHTRTQFDWSSGALRSDWLCP